MQAYLSGLSDSLVSGLDLASEKTASYIQSKRLASWPAEAGIAYAPTTAPTLRFKVSDGGWHDPTSWALSMQINNGGGSAITPIVQNPLSLFSRCVVKVGSQVVEDCTEFGRCVELMENFKNAAQKLSGDTQGWGAQVTTATGASAGDTNPAVKANEPIPNGGSRKVCVPLMCCLTKQGKFLPGDLAGPIVIELTLDSDRAACWDGPTERTYTITNPRIMGTCIDLTSDMAALYQQHSLQGKEIRFNLPCLFSSLHHTTNFGSVHLPRTFSILDTVWTSFFRSTVANSKFNRDFHYARADPTVALPAAEDTLQLQLSVGAKKFPDQPVDGIAQHHMYLMQSLGMQHPSPASIDINARQYASNKFVSGICLERANCGMGGETGMLSGISTRESQMLVVAGSGVAGAEMPDRVHAVLSYTAQLILLPGGVQVLD